MCWDEEDGFELKFPGFGRRKKREMKVMDENLNDLENAVEVSRAKIKQLEDLLTDSTMKLDAVGYESQQYLPAPVIEQSDGMVRLLEDKLRESNKKLAAMKAEIECATAAVEQSMEKVKHVETQLKESNMKVAAMKEEVECATSSVEQSDAKIKHIEMQVEDMKWEIQHPARDMVKPDAMFSHLEDKLRESNIKLETMKMELELATRTVKESDVRIEIPEVHIEKPDKVDDTKVEIKQVTRTVDHSDARVKYLEDRLKEATREVKELKDKLHATCVHKEYLETEALRERDKLLKTIEAMKEEEVKFYRNHIHELELLKSQTRGTRIRSKRRSKKH